jgi:DNA invertase Pin-like site-specific DNA recombinase
VAYFRVSTDHQGIDGNGIAAQRKAVADYLNGGKWRLVGEFTEVESGKRSDRPALAKALAACKRHKAKLVIAKLDRLARNVHFVSGLMERGVEFVACDMARHGYAVGSGRALVCAHDGVALRSC